jgi:hypothetical protein
MVIGRSLTWSPREISWVIELLEPHFFPKLSSTRARSQGDSEHGRTHKSRSACKHKKAVFGPTLGSEQSSSTVFGTSEPNSSRRRFAVCRIYLGFTFFCQSSIPRRTRGRCGDELCLAMPEAYFVDGVRDDLLLSSQRSLETECVAPCGVCPQLRRSPRP